MDPLIERFRAWAVDELSTHPNSLVAAPWKVRRFLLAASLKEIASLVAHNLTPSECVALAARGDEQSLMHLVELDKLFLSARFCKEWFSSAQSRRDTRFFKRLAKSVERDTLSEVMPAATLGIASYLLWFLGFEELGKRRLLDFVEDEDLANYPDPKSFDRFLSCIGIKSRTK